MYRWIITTANKNKLTMNAVNPAFELLEGDIRDLAICHQEADRICNLYQADTSSMPCLMDARLPLTIAT